MAKLRIAANVAVDVLDGRIVTKKPIADDEDRQVDENDEDVLEPFVAASDSDTFLVFPRLVLFLLHLRHWLQLHRGRGGFTARVEHKMISGHIYIQIKEATTTYC